MIKDFSQFDFDTISDAILHVRYTSREDLDLRAPALTHLENYLKTLASKASGPLLQCLDLGDSLLPTGRSSLPRTPTLALSVLN